MLRFPVPRTEFLSDTYEKNVWHGKQVFKPAYSWADVNASLYGWDPADGLVRLYNGALIEPAEYTETILDTGLRRSRIVKDKLYDQLEQGATLILNRLELKCPKVGALTHSIAQFVGEKAVANGYASFGGKGAFERHWDTHDVFAVQLIGRKKWTVYEPTVPLPLPNQKSLGRKDECPALPAFECVLEAGDVLYLPRGWWHVTESFEKEETFHIAVGVHTPKVVDYAVWLCGQVMPKYQASRCSVKFEDNDVDVTEFAAELVKQLARPENLKAFKEAVAAETRSHTPFSIERFASETSRVPPRAVLLNSPYQQTMSDGKLFSNGFQINIDETSRAPLARIFAAQPAVPQALMEEERLSQLLEELSKRDIVTVYR